MCMYGYMSNYLENLTREVTGTEKDEVCRCVVYVYMYDCICVVYVHICVYLYKCLRTYIHVHNLEARVFVFMCTYTIQLLCTFTYYYINTRHATALQAVHMCVQTHYTNPSHEYIYSYTHTHYTTLTGHI